MPAEVLYAALVASCNSYRRTLIRAYSSSLCVACPARHASIERSGVFQPASGGVIASVIFDYRSNVAFAIWEIDAVVLKQM